MIMELLGIAIILKIIVLPLLQHCLNCTDCVLMQLPADLLRRKRMERRMVSMTAAAATVPSDKCSMLG